MLVVDTQKRKLNRVIARTRNAHGTSPPTHDEDGGNAAMLGTKQQNRPNTPFFDSLQRLLTTSIPILERARMGAWTKGEGGETR